VLLDSVEHPRRPRGDVADGSEIAKLPMTPGRKRTVLPTELREGRRELASYENRAVVGNGERDRGGRRG
jgi:hypothetical protein